MVRPGIGIFGVVSPDLTGFVVTLARQTSTNGTSLHQSHFCETRQVFIVLDLRSSRGIGYWDRIFDNWINLLTYFKT